MLAKQWTKQTMIFLPVLCTFLAFGWGQSVMASHQATMKLFTLDRDVAELDFGQKSLSSYIDGGSKDQADIIQSAGLLAEAGGQIYEYGVITQDSDVTALGFRIRQLGLSLTHPEHVNLIRQYVDLITRNLPNDKTHIDEYNHDPSTFSKVAKNILEDLPPIGQTPFW